MMINLKWIMQQILQDYYWGNEERRVKPGTLHTWLFIGQLTGKQMADECAKIRLEQNE